MVFDIPSREIYPLASFRLDPNHTLSSWLYYYQKVPIVIWVLYSMTITWFFTFVTYPFDLQSTESGTTMLLAERWLEHLVLLRLVIFRPLKFTNSAYSYTKITKVINKIITRIKTHVVLKMRTYLIIFSTILKYQIRISGLYTLMFSLLPQQPFLIFIFKFFIAQL